MKAIPSRIKVFSFFFIFSCLLLGVRIFLCDVTLSYDEAEQVILAQQLSPGYPAQPPLYTWLQWGVFKLLGNHLFSLALLKYLLIGAAFYSYYLNARSACLDPILTWCATFSWALIPNISYDFLPHRTHVVLALLLSSLTWYWFVSVAHRPKLKYYVILGVLLGLGLLSKFNYLLFLILLCISALTLKDYRALLLTPKILISLCIGVGLASPYGIWLYSHKPLAFHAAYKLTTVGQGSLYGIARLMEALLFFILPLFLVRLFFPFQRKPEENRVNQLLWRYHLILLPVLIILIVSTGISNVRTHWLVPLLFLLPIALFSLVDKATYSVREAKCYLGLCVLIQIILVGVWIMRAPSVKDSTQSFSHIIH